MTEIVFFGIRKPQGDVWYHHLISLREVEARLVASFRGTRTRVFS